MRKLGLISLALVAAPLVFVACGGDDSSPGGTAGSAGTTSTGSSGSAGAAGAPPPPW